MTVPSETRSGDDEEQAAVLAVEEAAPAMPSSREESILVTADPPLEEEAPSTNKKVWLVFIGLFLSLVGYTLVQIYLVEWNFANLFVGIAFIVVYLCVACWSISKTDDTPHLRLRNAAYVCAVYSGIMGGILFVLRIQI